MGHRQHITSTANLKADNAELAASLSTFTKMLSRYVGYCMPIVRLELQVYSCGGRVVKAMDLKSIGVSPRRFESCPQRFLFFLLI